MSVAKGIAFGKAILFGEHAVVYRRPAIAVPVSNVTAQATLRTGPPATGFWIDAPDVDQRYALRDAPADDPLAAILRLTSRHLGKTLPPATLHVTSTVPLGRGLGSGAAVSTAIVRALAAFWGIELDPAEISPLVYEIERLHHGTPSGIDNTVIAFEQPVYFIKDRPIQRLRVAQPFTLVIADTGQVAATHEVVGDLRRRWQADPARYEKYFDQIAAIVNQARTLIEQPQADMTALGSLMNDNQRLLETVGVSSAALQHLIDIARQAGALGAKLSGAGWGGNIIALVQPERAGDVAQALAQTGAAQVIKTTVQ